MTKVKAQPSASLLSKLWQIYLRSLAANPLKTKALTGAVISTIGNVTAQKLIQKQEWNVTSTAKFATYGAIASSLVHFWYQFLDKVFKGKTGKGYILLRVLVDQAIFAPFLNSVFFSVMAIMEGQAATIPLRITKFLPGQLKNYWRLWPAVAYVNFTYVPPQYRVLVGNLVSLFWNIYLSIRNNRKQ